MAVYRCNSCGATTDTEATARALRESLGYGPGTQIAIAAPRKCDACGSADIAEVAAVPMREPTVAVARPEKRDPCEKCGAVFSDESLFCPGCGALRREQSFNLLLMLGMLVFMGVWVWASLVDGWGSHRPQWFCAAFPIIFGVMILRYLVRMLIDSVRAPKRGAPGVTAPISPVPAPQSAPGDEFARLEAQKQTWIGWDHDQLIRTFGPPQVVNGSGADEWLGFDVGGYTVSVHLIDGVVASAEVFAPFPS
jgi:hypothetical protein